MLQGASSEQAQNHLLTAPNRLLKKGTFWERFVSSRFFHGLAQPVKPSDVFGFF